MKVWRNLPRFSRIRRMFSRMRPAFQVIPGLFSLIRRTFSLLPLPFPFLRRAFSFIPRTFSGVRLLFARDRCLVSFNQFLGSLTHRRTEFTLPVNERQTDLD
jgi:hypothetical protein